MWMVLVIVVVVFASGAAFAQMFPVAQKCSVNLNTSGTLPLSMYLLPNGSGTPFSACYDANGTVVVATIVVTLVDANGNRAINVPASSVRIEQSGSPLSWCSDTFYPPPAHAPNMADGPSNLSGQSIFTLAYHGGGFLPGPLQVWVKEVNGNWSLVPSTLPVTFNSADITGDLAVNLGDVGIFAADYFGAYHYRSDFNNDSSVNLTDVQLLSNAIGITCP